MKKIELKGNTLDYLTNSWLFPSILILFVLCSYLIMQRLSYAIITLAIAWSLILFASRRSTKNGELKTGFSLEFGVNELICKHNNSIFWHVPYNKISHFSVEPAFKPSWLNPKYSFALIYTKDGDSYSLPVQIGKEKSEEIRIAVEKAIA
jgi:hypothetical protein